MATYDERRSIGMYWYNKSSDLHGAAAVLWSAIQSNGPTIQAECDLGSSYQFKVALPLPFRMICGMSIELMLKAVLVADGKEPPTTHDLKSLAKTTGVQFTQAQYPLLEILSESIVWDGRYPVPTPKRRQSFQRLRDLKTEHLRDKKAIGKMQFLVSNAALDWRSYDELRTIAAQKFYEISGSAAA